jgi:hypothetical protein
LFLYKKQFSTKNFARSLAFLHSRLFYKEKIDEFFQNYYKMWRKKMLKKEIKYTILYCVCENFCDSMLLRSGSAKIRN